MKRLFSVSVTEYGEIERLMKFYRDLGYECEEIQVVIMVAGE